MQQVSSTEKEMPLHGKSEILSEHEHDIPSVNDIGNLNAVLPSSLVADESVSHEAKSIYISTMNRISAYALGIFMIVFVMFSMVVDYFEDHYNLKYLIVGMLASCVFALAWLRDKRRNPVVSQLVLGFTLAALSVYLLIFDGPKDGSAMVWVVVTPCTIVLCMGLRYSAITFACLYAIMLILFFTPLGEYRAVQLTSELEIRILLVTLSSFSFVWFLEYARFKTNFALHAAAYNIEQSSLTDALTGLGNRRDFDRSLKWTMARTERSKIQYSLAILDIDHFKRVNDTYGHSVGDDVLRHIANEVETQIRNADRIFRWGGEEFTIIMPSTNMEKAVAGAERVRKHLEKTPFILGDEKLYLTVSMGIYSGTEVHDAAYPLHIADQCLYRAKSTGRNKVIAGIE